MKNNKTIMLIGAKYLESIESVAERMLNEAKNGFNVKVEFNGVVLTSEGMNSIEDIIRQKDLLQTEKHEKYISSLEYLVDEERKKAKEIEDNNMLEKLKKTFSELDLNNMNTLLSWTEKMSNSKNDVEFNRTILLPALREAGYLDLYAFMQVYPEEFLNNITVKEYIQVSKNNHKIGLYLISRCMSDIDCTGYISGVMSLYIRDYKNKLKSQKNIRKTLEQKPAE